MKKRKLDSNVTFPGRKGCNKHMMNVELKKSIFKSVLDLKNKSTFIKHDYAAITTNVVQESCDLG